MLALAQLPPSFDASQKILDQDMMDLLASNAPKKHKELMQDQGFDPQTATTDQFVEICERAESKAALRTKNERNRSDDEMMTLPKTNAQARSPTRKGQPSPTRIKELHTSVKNIDLTPLTTARTVKFYPERKTGRRKTLSKSLSTKTSTKRKHANSTFFKKTRVKRKRNGLGPTTSLTSLRTPIRTTTSAAAKYPNAQTLSVPNETLTTQTAAATQATAAPHPIPTPTKKLATGRTIIC
jgi:hypothetical protein